MPAPGKAAVPQGAVSKGCCPEPASAVGQNRIRGKGVGLPPYRSLLDRVKQAFDRSIITSLCSLPSCDGSRREMSTPPLAGAGMPPGAFSGTQAQAAREVNTASLCRIGQETVQDIVFRTMEIFQLLRNMQVRNNYLYTQLPCFYHQLSVYIDSRDTLENSVKLL